MKFRTEIIIEPSDFKLSHTCKIAVQGSCFAENIASKLSDTGFSVDLNPFGIAYNPLSLAQNLNRLLDNQPYTKDELFKDKEIYHSFSHHSRFSGTEPESVLERINSQMRDSFAFLQTAGLLTVTFGTAFVYRLQSTGEIVSNCHKLPAKLFSYKRLKIEEIVREWNSLLIRLRTLHPELAVLFTVSPIRHWKDGAHENQLSKSTLLLAVDELIRTNSRCYYFPAYELVLDDLRDYRFYADDLFHPSSQAIDYVWEKFTEAWMEKETIKKMHEFEQIHKSLHHVPFQPESEEYRQFRKKTEAKLKELMGSLYHIPLP